jgi:hypothetical protein
MMHRILDLLMALCFILNDDLTTLSTENVNPAPLPSNT